MGRMNYICFVKWWVYKSAYGDLDYMSLFSQLLGSVLEKLLLPGSVILDGMRVYISPMS